MDAKRYARLVELFQKACELPGGEREPWLERECAGDDDLLRRALAMLASDATASDVLERAACEAGELLAGGPEQDDDVVPERIGDFRVLRRIGAGGMGIVYEAEQDQPRRRVALKLIHPGLTTRRHLKRFAFEAEVLGWLEHPGIARIYAAGQAETPWGELPYFAMELVEGPPVTQWVEERALSLRARVELLARLCDAVEHAHGKGLVHRDLKPGNVLIRADGRPVVLDFGVARLVEGAAHEARSRLTREGGAVGTVAYSSPEQLRGAREDLDVRSDVYALGVLAFEVLTGRLPYDVAGDAPLADLARAIEADEPRRLRGVDPRLPVDLDTILAKALSKEPARRYASASALAADLRRWLDHEPITARPTSAAYRLARFSRRHRALVVASAAVAISLVAATVVSALARAREVRARERAVDEAAAASEVADYVVGLFESADPLRAGGENPRARDLLERGVQDMAGAFDERPAVRARLLQVLGRAHVGLGMFGEAEPLLLEAEGLQRALGEGQELALARTLLDLAEANQAGADHARGLRLAREALELRRAHTPGDHVALARAESTVGLLELWGNRFDEAERWIGSALAHAERSGDPAEVMRIRAEYGTALAWQGRYEDGLELLRAAAAGAHEIAPGDFLEAFALGRLADVLASVGDYEAALEPARRAVQVARGLLASDSLYVLGLEQVLGTMLSETGRHDEAERLLVDVVERLERRHGSEHVQSIRARTGLAGVLQEQRRHDEARPLYERALAEYERLHGPDHALTLSVANNLALLHKQTGAYSEALALETRVWRARERTLGGEHLLTLNSRRKCGQHLRLLGRVDEAEEHLLETFEACSEHLGVEDPETAYVALDLADVFRAQGRPDEAEAILSDALERVETETTRGRLMHRWLSEALGRPVGD